MIIALYISIRKLNKLNIIIESDWESYRDIKNNNGTKFMIHILV